MELHGGGDKFSGWEEYESLGGLLTVGQVPVEGEMSKFVNVLID